MNLSTIVTRPNSKGQIVIPKKFREKLDIDEEVLLSLIIQGNGVFISPLKRSTSTSDSKQIFQEVLKMTAGAWKGDDWSDTEQKRQQIELQATKDRKKAW